MLGRGSLVTARPGHWAVAHSRLWDQCRSMATRQRRWNWPGIGQALSTEWRELGGLGRTALIGVIVSGLVAVALGFTIPAIVSRHILESRMELLGHITDDLPGLDRLPRTSDATLSPAFDEAVRLRLLGGETVRVKLWDPDGQIVYSDIPELVGRRFGVGSGVQSALAGAPSFEVTDLSEPENIFERNFGELLEFYLPVRSSDGRVQAVFEVYQRAEAFGATMGDIRRTVWVSILSGLGILGLFMGILTLANARVAQRRHREVEALLGQLVRAEERERSRILGALHDDIGQPLYRLLYGLEAARGRAGGRPGIASDLAALETVARDIERSLRTELRNLRRDLSEDLGLEPALADLVETMRRESGISADLTVTSTGPVSAPARRALYGAAREALSNVRRHAHAESVKVRLQESDGTVILEVIDDGLGLRGGEGIGLTIARQRLIDVGGSLTIRARRQQHGTTLRAAVPRAGASGAD